MFPLWLRLLQVTVFDSRSADHDGLAVPTFFGISTRTLAQAGTASSSPALTTIPPRATVGLRVYPYDLEKNRGCEIKGVQ